jgi:hypothetical protein
MLHISIVLDDTHLRAWEQTDSVLGKHLVRLLKQSELELFVGPSPRDQVGKPPPLGGTFHYHLRKDDGVCGCIDNTRLCHGSLLSPVWSFRMAIALLGMVKPESCNTHTAIATMSTPASITTKAIDLCAILGKFSLRRLLGGSAAADWDYLDVRR